MSGRAYISINGLQLRARFSPREQAEVLRALADQLALMRSRVNRRLIAFMAGPPGSGKSALATSLCDCARDYSMQALGLDGFHYPQAILRSRSAVVGGYDTPLIDIKGRPETFDCALFQEYLARAAAESYLEWPVYDRRIHDVSAETLEVAADILIIEGNWLLMNLPGWREARAYADIAISISAPDYLLMPRLITRKTRGGASETQAREWYARVDGPNCALYGELSAPADIRIALMSDGLRLIPENRLASYNKPRSSCRI